MSSASLIKEKRKYENLKSNLAIVVRDLRSANNYINDAKNCITKNYLINDMSADENYTLENFDKITEMVNHINGNVIPEINRVIARLQREIEEALEREAAAAAAASAATASTATK